MTADEGGRASPAGQRWGAVRPDGDRTCVRSTSDPSPRHSKAHFGARPWA